VGGLNVVEIFKAEKPRARMAHTGERLSAGHSLETEIEHFHRYYMARNFCRGRDVLDSRSKRWSISSITTPSCPKRGASCGLAAS